MGSIGSGRERSQCETKHGRGAKAWVCPCKPAVQVPCPTYGPAHSSRASVWCVCVAVSHRRTKRAGQGAARARGRARCAPGAVGSAQNSCCMDPSPKSHPDAVKQLEPTVVMRHCARAAPRPHLSWRLRHQAQGSQDAAARLHSCLVGELGAPVAGRTRAQDTSSVRRGRSRSCCWPAAEK